MSMVSIFLAHLFSLFPQITCSECVRNGQMIVSGGTGGVVSFWSIQNTMQVRIQCMFEVFR